MKRQCCIAVILSILVLPLAACTTNSGVTEPEAESLMTEEEAIGIASDILPAEVVACAKIIAMLRTELGPHGFWQVQFLNTNVTQNELGWQEDDKTRLGPEAVYPNVIITVDAKTGDIVLREATSGVLLGGPLPPAPTTSEEALSVQINSPEDGAKLSTNLLNVSGIVSDPQAVVEINGAKARVGEDGTFYAYIELSEGTNTVRALATMADSHAGQSINVTFDPLLVLVLDYLAPEPGVDYTKAPLIISGYVSHPTAKVAVDGIQASVEKDGSYSASVQLNEGTNFVEIEATLDEKRDYMRHSIDVTPEGEVSSSPLMGAARLSGVPPVKLRAGEMTSVDIQLQSGKRDIRRPGELRWEV